MLALISWAISALVVSVGGRPSADLGERKPGQEQKPKDGVEGPGESWSHRDMGGSGDTSRERKSLGGLCQACGF